FEKLNYKFTLNPAIDYAFCACCTTIKINQISLSCLMQGRKPFEEKLFTNFQLSDRVPVDNIYRRLKESLDLRFLYKLTARYYGTEGQESIDPVVFLTHAGRLPRKSGQRQTHNQYSLPSIRHTLFYWLQH